MPASVKANDALYRSVSPAVDDSNIPCASILPFSWVTRRPSSSACSSNRSAISVSALYLRERSRDHGEVMNACLAAAMAAPASASPPSYH